MGSASYRLLSLKLSEKNTQRSLLASHSNMSVEANNMSDEITHVLFNPSTTAIIQMLEMMKITPSFLLFDVEKCHLVVI